jgi:hypothetical protein
MLLPLVLAVLAAAQGRTEPDVRPPPSLSGAVSPRREEWSD